LLESLGHGTAKKAKAHDPDAALRRSTRRTGLPARGALVGHVVGNVPVKSEDREGGVLDHAPREVRIDHPNDLNVRRNRVKVQLIDAGAYSEQDLEAGQGSPEVRRRNPGNQILDFVRCPDVGPEPE
jgi:hypothetical protein